MGKPLVALSVALRAFSQACRATGAVLFAHFIARGQRDCARCHKLNCKDLKAGGSTRLAYKVGPTSEHKPGETRITQSDYRTHLSEFFKGDKLVPSITHG